MCVIRYSITCLKVLGTFVFSSLSKEPLSNKERKKGKKAKER